jgi:hypothetical protein
MVRELAGWNPDRAKAIVRWPLREALLAYVARLKAEALNAFRFESLMWSVLAPHAKKKTDPPKFPEILKG